MGISRRFLNLIHGTSYRATKWLVNSATASSRKLSTVGSGSESLLNLIVDNKYPGVASLRLVDLRGQLFSTSTPPSTFREVPESAAVQDTASYTQAADDPDYLQKLEKVTDLRMDWFHLPPAIFSFQVTAGVPIRYGVDLLPLKDHKVLINHHSGGTFLFDVDTYHTVTMPNLNKRKGMETISLFVPSADADGHLAGDGSLYIMERVPEPELGRSTLSDQFEALVYRSPTMTFSSPSADCQRLPPPPFLCDPDNRYPYPRITACALVGSDIYISVERAGTYCLDTLSNTWGRVGQWTLPFHGKVEYVPELNLWVGLSDRHGHFAAADLSVMDSQPQLVDTGSWMEREVPDEWLVSSYGPRLVNLGSGRFCIARFFYTMLMEGDSVAETNKILVLTGLEVTSAVHDGNHNGNRSREVKLTLRQHRSKCHICDRNNIVAVF